MSTTTTKDRMRTLLKALNAQDRLQTAETTFQTEVADVTYRSLGSLYGVTYSKGCFRPSVFSAYDTWF